MGALIEQAASYIGSKPQPTAFKNAFHYDVPTGWMNDPHGIVFFNGMYHVFYQFEPWGDRSGPRFWGHAVTKDFVSWSTMAPALAPDMPYDRDGCWSGSAFVEDGLLWLMYTGNRYVVQEQCLACSKDGETFAKLSTNPVLPITKMPESGASHSFRDPYVIQTEAGLYCFVGSKNVNEDCGQILLYKRKQEAWECVGALWKDNSMKDPGICECPCYVRSGDTGILIYSRNFVPTQGKRFCNFGDTVAHIGTVDFENCAFDGGALITLDYGFDFYAGQVVKIHGRIILIGWMQMWEVTYPTEQFGWVGSLTFPRELTVKDGVLYQAPVKELDAYCVEVDRGTLAGEMVMTKRPLRLNVDMDSGNRFTISVEGNDGGISVQYDPLHRELTMNRYGNIPESCTPFEENTETRSVRLSNGDTLSLDILIDNSSIEVFANSGAEVMTGTYFLSGGVVSLKTSQELSYVVYEIITERGAI